MRLKIFVLVAILFISLFCNAAALPNLKLNWVQYSPDSERIVAEIFNDSNEKAEGFVVDFYVDGEMVGRYPSEEAVELGPGSIMQIFEYFPYDGKTHEFYAVVDAGDKVKESNERDNASFDEILSQEALRERFLEEDKSAEMAGEDIFSSPLLWAVLAFLLTIIVLFIVITVVRKKYE